MRADTIEAVDRVHSQADVDEVEHHEVRVAVLHERRAMGRMLQDPIISVLSDLRYTFHVAKALTTAPRWSVGSVTGQEVKSRARWAGCSR